ncbi:MAG: PHB depolymerase family esterase [Candidatus Uhrbacteria bacterium]
MFCKITIALCLTGAIITLSACSVEVNPGSTPTVDPENGSAFNWATIEPNFPEIDPTEDPEDNRLEPYEWIPDDYDPASEWPLIVFLHAYGWDALELATDIYGLPQRVNEDGFILVAPQGLIDEIGNTFWSANKTCCDYYGLGQDDHAYLENLIAEYVEAYSIDPDQIYVYGSSNGAFMAHAYACGHSSQIAAMVTISGVDELDFVACDAQDPISVLQIHGTADPDVIYNGHPGDDVPKPLMRGYPGAMESAEHWAERSGCELVPDEIGTLNLDWMQPGSETAMYQWSDCDNEVTVEHWAVEGATHTLCVWDVPNYVENVFGEQTLTWLLAQ